MIDPNRVALYIPAEIIAQNKTKMRLFERIGAQLGYVIRGRPEELDRLPSDVVPVVGCTPALRPWIERWRASGKQWIYWDRGYMRRVYATWLPKGDGIGVPMGYYRWHIGTPQMTEIYDVPSDRWDALKLTLSPWRMRDGHIVVAHTGADYWNLHADMDWTRRTVELLKQHTKRKIVVRDKESKVPLGDELANAHALVTHGSIAAVEAVIMGCPVFVDPMSAAALVGQTDMTKIEEPIYPAREKWVHSLAHCQFKEDELIDGTLWRLIR